MEDDAAERPVLRHIEAMVAEEHALLGLAVLADAQRVRLRALQVELDQCWDLLRRQRAEREMGRDPARVQVRPPEMVEKYTG